MKSLIKIICRYSLTVGLVIFVIFASNACVFAGIAYFTMRDSNELVHGRLTMEEIGEQMLVGGDKAEQDGRGQGDTEQAIEKGGIRLSEVGLKILEGTDFVWMMALDKDGSVVWDWELPDEIPRSYSLQDVSVFSRWYLKDYPVRTWKCGELLLVFGCDPEKAVRYDALMSAQCFEFLPVYLKALVIANFAIIILFIVCFGLRFYQSMRPVTEGIEKLSLGEAVNIPENGPMEELAKKLNEVSKRLIRQQNALAKRDEARTEWIAGVSHDIRTPLSLIVGYSDKLSKDEGLSEQNRRAAENMKGQSLIIRQLIADLNLTSKLVYQAQPLKKQVCSPAAILRECAAEVYNDGFVAEACGDSFAAGGFSNTEQDTGESASDFSVEIVVKREAESIRITADEGLLKRALRNLIGNSIRHNEKGCHVTVFLSADRSRIYWRVVDTGFGIPEIIVKSIDRTDTSVHIMGLRLVSQIAKAHGGELVFIRRDSGTYDVEFSVGREM